MYILIINLYLFIKGENFSLPDCSYTYPLSVGLRFAESLRPVCIKQKENKKLSRVSNAKSLLTSPVDRLCHGAPNQPIRDGTGTVERKKNKKNFRVPNVKSPIYFSFIL